MMDRQQRTDLIGCTLGLLFGFAGIFMLRCSNLNQNFMKVLIGALIIGCILLCFSCKKAVDDTQKKAKNAVVNQFFDITNPREVYCIFSLQGYEEKMLRIITSNSNVKFYASLNDDESIRITAVCGEKQIYQEDISDHRYFLLHFGFVIEDKES